MATLVKVPPQGGPTMSSLEIAELTGKLHKSILRDIRRMLETLGIQREQFCSGYVDEKGESRICYNLPRRETEILITGYDVQRRAAVIDRWYALETGAAKPALAASPAAAELQEFIEVGELLGVPRHIVEAEGVKMLRNTTGKDFSPLLLASPAQNDIAFEDMMLEPKEIGARHGLSAIAVNRALADAGHQTKVNGEWVPTDSARGMASRHQWATAEKTGYNLKWRVSFVEQVIKAAA